MKQKILDFLPRAGALLVVISLLLCCVVPARAASTSEAVTYYDITDYNMSGTITNGATVKLTFDVADLASQYAEAYTSSYWSLLITGDFDGTKLVTSYGATYLSNTVCSYQFTLDDDWIETPSISCKQENVGVTGHYRITGAYLVNSPYVTKHDAYYSEQINGFTFSEVYNNLYNSSYFASVPDDGSLPTLSGLSSYIFTPRYVPCSTLYFVIGFDYGVPEDLNISAFACNASGQVTEVYDCDMTLLSSSGYYYQYHVEITGPFTEPVFVCVSFSDDGGEDVSFDGFYAGYNRILNTNFLLDEIREQVTQSRVYLSAIRSKIIELANGMTQLLNGLNNGDFGSSASTNIFDSWNATITGLSGNFQSVVDAVEGIAGEVTSGLSSSINSISTAVDGITGSVTSGLSSSINSISTAVDGIAGSVADSLASSFDSLTDATSSIAGSVVDGLASSFDSLTEATSSIAGDIIDGLPDIVGELSDLPGKIKAAFTPSWQTDAFGIVDFSSVLDIFTSGYNSISGLFGFQDIFDDP